MNQIKGKRDLYSLGGKDYLIAKNANKEIEIKIEILPLFDWTIHKDRIKNQLKYSNYFIS